ncbi:Importin 9 [Chamberlinius hualienensis]
MATNNSLSNSLKEALFETLTAILSPQHDVRVTAEEQIKALEVTEEFGIHLTELSLDSNAPLEIKQLASVLLKQYVESHWSHNANKYRPPEVAENVKVMIRQILPLGLKEQVSRIRSSAAYAIAAIAQWDWPESWPNLYDIIINFLKCDDANTVHGAMRALTELSRDVTDTQMPGIAPLIFPEMYRIFTESGKYSLSTRRRAIEIFCTCSTMLSSMPEPTAKTLLFPFIPLFTEALVTALQDKNPTTSNSGIKMEALKTLTILIRRYPWQMINWLPQILTPVWNTLTECASMYVRSVVNESGEYDDSCDSDGENIGFNNLLFSIFEFVHGLVDTPKFQETVRKGLIDLIYYIVLYMQITEEQASTWLENPDKFVEDEDNHTFSYSVRISAIDVLVSLTEEFETECGAGLIEAVTKHIQEADALRQAGSPHWWKIYESCMLAMGTAKELFIENFQKGKLDFDLTGFVRNIVLVHISSSVSPYLTGKCMWFASCYAPMMSIENVERCLEATVHNLNQNTFQVVRISAVRSILGFTDFFSSSGKSDIVTPYLERILDGLIVLATRVISEVLALVLEALAAVLPINQNFTVAHESKVTPLALAIFLKYHSDPVIIYQVQEVLKELVKNSLCNSSVQHRLLPMLVSILNAPDDKIPTDLQPIALDILETVVRNSSPPLSQSLIEQAYPAVAQCTLRSDDTAIMQNGGQCIQAYVSVDVQRLVEWHDEQGRDGLWYAVQVASKLLDPRSPEVTATFVGRLVTALSLKAGNLLSDNLDLILRAVLSKMQKAESLIVIQGLVMVFARLINDQMEAVLEFLSSVPGPTGKSALDFVLVEWCSKQHLFFGTYERKISTLALVKLLQHGIATQDPRIVNIEIKGDQLFSLDERIKTRSQTKSRPDQWTVIPLLVKICKLIINEMVNVMEVALDMENEGKDNCEWADIDESAGNCENDEEHSDDDDGLPCSSSRFYDDLCDSDEIGEEDPDILADPLNAVDLRNFLGQFFQSFVQLPCFREFANHLTVEEKHALKTIGIIL